MQKKSFKIRATYLFNSLAVILLILSTFIYTNFEATKDKIYSVNKEANLEYVKSLADNLSKDIVRISQKNLHNTINEDTILRDYIESDLRLFVTTKYKYIYLLTKDENNDFMILADSTKNKKEKKKLNKIYNNSNKNNLEYVYNNKKFIYEEHDSKEQSFVATYMEPIIVDNIIEAIIVVEFTLQEQNTISDELQTLKEMLGYVIIFFIIIFFVIVWFSFIDIKREKQKNMAFDNLRKSNKNLELETAKVHELNNTLEHKVDIEVEKNRLQDQQLVQQSRLAQMGEMISMIAHQWRQPLAAISSTSVAINFQAQLDNLDKENVIELTQKISEYSQHLSSTIDDFRDFFKPNKVKKKTSFTEIVKSVSSIIESSILSKEIQLVKILDYNDQFYTYSNEVKQVVLNLVKNSEDILIDNKPQNPCITIQTYKKDNNLILEVRDNGGGIPRDIIEHIFDPYFSTKTQKDGTGLGLYMSKTIIEEHCAGKLLASNDSEGAVFRIILGNTNE